MPLGYPEPKSSLTQLLMAHNGYTLAKDQLKTFSSCFRERRPRGEPAHIITSWEALHATTAAAGFLLLYFLLLALRYLISLGDDDKHCGVTFSVGVYVWMHV